MQPLKNGAFSVAGINNVAAIAISNKNESICDVHRKKFK